jgi:hypothetical protein
VKILVSVLLFVLLFCVQTNAVQSPDADPWKALSFLEGTWTANTQGGSARAQGSGCYTFQPELGRHVLARHSSDSAGCKGPTTYDCEHSDLLCVYPEAGSQSLKAIYFDNESHVIHYDVTTPSSATAIFISEVSGSGPQSRLVYELKGAVMSGKFEIRMPGQNEWKTYLEWSGTRK